MRARAKATWGFWPSVSCRTVPRPMGCAAPRTTSEAAGCAPLLVVLSSATALPIGDDNSDSESCEARRMRPGRAAAGATDEGGERAGSGGEGAWLATVFDVAPGLSVIGL